MIGEVMKGKSARVIDAFAVERKGEAERYRPYANLPNRTLLYPFSLSLSFPFPLYSHHSRLTSRLTAITRVRPTGGTVRAWPT
jgi:hypothetical protein